MTEVKVNLYQQIDEIFLKITGNGLEFEFCIQLQRDVMHASAFRLRVLTLHEYRIFPVPSWNADGKEITSDPADECLWSDRSTWLSQQEIMAESVEEAKLKVIDIMSDFLANSFGESSLESLKTYWSN